MSATPSPPRRRAGLRRRALAALTIGVGAATLGPLLPALVVAGLAAVGMVFDGERTVPMLSFPAALANAVSFIVVNGGGATALLCGLALAGLVLWNGSLRPIAVTRTAAFVAALVSLWLARGAPFPGAAALTVAFIVAAVVTAQTLYRLALSWRLLPQE